jgi:hypothetical protein
LGEEDPLKIAEVSKHGPQGQRLPRVAEVRQAQARAYSRAVLAPSRRSRHRTNDASLTLVDNVCSELKIGRRT